MAGALSVLVVFLAGAVFYLKLGQTATSLIIRFEADKDIDFFGRPDGSFRIFIVRLGNDFNYLFSQFSLPPERFLSYISQFRHWLSRY